MLNRGNTLIFEYAVSFRMPPIHYYPCEFIIISHLKRFRRYWESTIYRTSKRGCHHCGSDLDVISIHHILPITELGNNRYRNLIPLCSKCHYKIHNTFEINIPTPQNLNVALLKKRDKLLRKLYIEGKRRLNEEFIYKHLIIDETIKTLINQGMINRLYEKIIDWYEKGLLKNPINLFISHHLYKTNYAT